MFREQVHRCAKFGGPPRATEKVLRCMWRELDDWWHNIEQRKEGKLRYTLGEATRIVNSLDRDKPIDELAYLLLIESNLSDMLKLKGSLDYAKNLCVCPEFLSRNDKGEFVVHQTFATREEAVVRVLENLQEENRR